MEEWMATYRHRTTGLLESRIFQMSDKTSWAQAAEYISKFTRSWQRLLSIEWLESNKR